MSGTTEEWGRVAVSLPGWRWMRGMQTLPLPTPGVPDPDDPATAGCLLALLGDGYAVAVSIDGWVSIGSWPTVIAEGASMGRACIAAAAALGRWPGGEG